MFQDQEYASLFLYLRWTSGLSNLLRDHLMTADLILTYRGLDLTRYPYVEDNAGKALPLGVYVSPSTSRNQSG